MAEFKLGRIKFVWKDAWSAGTEYLKDDVIRHGGKTYICVIGHTADSNFYTDLDNVPTRWNQVSDGTEWKGDWSTSTDYKLNDLVKYGGRVYVCLTPHTSAGTEADGLELDQAKWDIFAENFDWKGDWSTSTRYKINDIVTYGGVSYLCIEEHTSSATTTDGLEVDLAKWDVYAEAFDWKNTWGTATRYRPNDVVKYGGILYVCIEGHTSAATVNDGLETDQSKWNTFFGGFDYKGDWSGSSVRYKVNDLVKYGATVWICVNAHTSTATFSEANFNVFVEGLQFEDTWSGATTYQIGDIVTYGGFAYVAVKNNSGVTPTTVNDDWDLYTVGFKVQGDWSGVTAYKVGDVVRVNGYTYVATADSTNQEPPNVTYWSLLNQGIEWRHDWQDTTDYKLGDSVKYGLNSYICVLGHTSETANRPDNDVSGTYWNQLSGGAEESNLTTQGDLVYYGGAGPTRLPVGEQGQVLQVDNNTPTWAYFGVSDDVLYVRAHGGIDEPAPINGSNIDRPFATVRYATEQIMKGYKNPQAAHLISRNRQFITKEIVEWVDYQIANTIAPFGGAFTYDKTKCERDMGFLVDAIVYDITHGGNKRSREAALQYFTSGGASYVAGQEAETAAAIEYGLTLIATPILTSVDPASNYQTLNGVGSPIPQYKNTDYTAEDGIQNRVDTLGSIVADAVASSDVNGIPALERVNTTISVKTGTQTEILPIRVPRDTAVVGDELRSTRIEPNASIVDSADTPYSLAALAHFESIVSDVMQGSGISTQSGNGVTQIVLADTNFAGNATVGTAAATLLQNIQDEIDFRVNGNGSAVAFTGSNDATGTYEVYAGIEMLERNRDFVIADVLAYIANTYSGYVYDTDKCTRDLNRYIDGIKMDLIYTSNYESLLNARYYSNAVTGSLTEDMFYVRNGTGLRNCTVQGLTGTLGAANSYGTQRPTAGAYVSLDPGWGTTHEEVWIDSKSCYVQNVTTFGTGAVGCKIDGALHDGGNDSIVSNDFTQVISDGIGVWCTNLGRTELVSVFSYYAHIGYLAENGGKIRATNGNSSYGTFGCVAEGVDATEVPVTAEVDNQANDASIDNVFTDGNEILAFEYFNAGENYTSGTITISGTGANADSVANEFRHQGIYKVRMTDTGSGIGGEGYNYAQNVAQSGDSTSITIAATDDALTGQYNGMRVVIIDGAGSGQYGYIGAFNAGSKIATVFKESTGTAGWDHVKPGTPIVNLDNSSEYAIEPRIAVASGASTSAASGALPSASAWTDVTFGHYEDTKDTFADIEPAKSNPGDAGSGLAIHVSKDNSGTYSVASIVNGGTGYDATSVTNTLTIQGSDLGGADVVNDATVTIDAVDLGTGKVTSASITGTGFTPRLVAVASGGTAAGYSLDAGQTWTAGLMPVASDWQSVASVVVSGQIYFAAIASGGNDAAYSTDGISWTSATMNATATWIAVASGYDKTFKVPALVAVAQGGTIAGKSTDGGQSWSGSTLPSSSNWRDIAHGGGTFVAVGESGAVAYTVDSGATWTAGTMPDTANYNSVAFGNNRFVAVASDGSIAYSFDGETWYAGASIASGTYSHIRYGNGTFTTVRTNDGVAYSSQYGVDDNWTTVSGQGAIGHTGIAYAHTMDYSRQGFITTANASTTSRIVQPGGTAFLRAKVADGKIYQINVLEPGANYSSTPTVTITDPNNIGTDAPTQVRISNRVLSTPTFNNTGIAYETASARIEGDGFADNYQPGTYMFVKNMPEVPLPGSNVEFASLPGNYYKLVSVTSLIQQADDTYTARLQLSPEMTVADAPDHEDALTISIRYSQVRLTGHDFLDIGTGNFQDTNYPGTPVNDPDPTKEAIEGGGGRVFYTSTDQDGNFRVGDLFTVEQSTGIATLNADAFNISGLQELTLGSIDLGGTSATINEFSTDPFFTADSDSVVPTQRAIKAYITSQIGGGASELNVNTLTAGQIFIANNTIGTTTGVEIQVQAKLNFTGGVDGSPLAVSYYFLK